MDCAAAFHLQVPVGRKIYSASVIASLFIGVSSNNPDISTFNFLLLRDTLTEVIKFSPPTVLCNKLYHTLKLHYIVIMILWHNVFTPSKDLY